MDGHIFETVGHAAVMFHHLHSPSHTRRPGSLSADDFWELSKYLLRELNVLGPEEYKEKALSGDLDSRDTIFTFDDGLKSQIDVAVPILEDLGIRAIFGPYTAIFSDSPDPMEIFAEFRATQFDEFGHYWQDFVMFLLGLEILNEAILDAFPEEWLAGFDFYSREERQFRWVRDEILGRELYQDLMFRFMNRYPFFSPEECREKLFMSAEDVRHLRDEGHGFSLHSHSHPTTLSQLSYVEQRSEYLANASWFESNLGLTPEFVAHPCGSYDNNTIAILDELGIRIGFRSSPTRSPSNGLLEIPRHDHATLARETIWKKP